MTKKPHILQLLPFLFIFVISACTLSITPRNADSTSESISLVTTASPIPIVLTKEIPTIPAPLPTSTLIPNSSIKLPSIADVVQQVRPAVVGVVAETIKRDLWTGRHFRDFASGSGVLFLENGYILTNNHVIQDAHRINVTIGDGRSLAARLVGSDRLSDLAVLQLEGSSYPHIPLGDSTRLRAGDWVIAIGNALALGQEPTVTLGVISALNRSIDLDARITLTDLIQTDALINPGNSGGPLLNLEGEIIGINTAAIRGLQAEGLGFAIPSQIANLVAQQLIQNGRVIWPWLGVATSDINPAVAVEMGLALTQGVLVTNIFLTAPANMAGILQNDIIVRLDNHLTPDTKTLSTLLRTRYQIGQEILVTINRQGNEIAFRLTLEEMPR